MLRTALVFAVVLLLSACAPGTNIRTSTDPVYGTTMVRMDGNALAGGCFGCGSIELNISKFMRPDSPVPLYDLVVDYRGGDWLFIERGQSLALRVDGELIRFTSDRGSGPYRNVVYGGNVTETAYYMVDASQLRRIANAAEVHVRVDGSQYYAAREFTPANFENFKRFIAEHVN